MGKIRGIWAVNQLFRKVCYSTSSSSFLQKEVVIFSFSRDKRIIFVKQRTTLLLSGFGKFTIKNVKVTLSLPVD